MKQFEFMAELTTLLSSLPENERREILYDYKEHFRSGLDLGKTEEEICNSLGSPKTIASEFLPTSSTTNNHNENSVHYQGSDYHSYRSSGRSVIGIIFISFMLLIFNSIFAGIYVGILGMFLGLYGATIGLFFGGITLFFSTIFSFVPNNIIIPPILVSNSLASMFLSLGGIALSGLLFIGLVYATKVLIKLTIKYVVWNINLIKG